jgi:hypothetical protein
MKFDKLLIYALGVAILAGIVDLITNLMQGAGFIATDASMTFVTFICWASYFLFGCNLKGAWAAWLSFIPGILAAIAMFELVGVFAGAGMDVATLAIPIAVFILVIFMILFEKVPYFNNVAAIFLGTGIFFGLMGTPAIGAKGYLMVGIGELVYAAIGLIAGWLTIQINTAVSKSGSKA